MNKKRWSRYSKNIYEKEYNLIKQEKAILSLEKLMYIIDLKQKRLL